MGLLDKVFAAVTPPETDVARVEARAKARTVSKVGDWLSLVLDHHLDLEDAFHNQVPGRIRAVRWCRCQRLSGDV